MTVISLTILAKEQMIFGQVFAILLGSWATASRVALVCQKLDAEEPARKNVRRGKRASIYPFKSNKNL